MMSITNKHSNIFSKQLYSVFVCNVLAKYRLKKNNNMYELLEMKKKMHSITNQTWADQFVTLKLTINYAILINVPSQIHFKFVPGLVTLNCCTIKTTSADQSHKNTLCAMPLSVFGSYPRTTKQLTFNVQLCQLGRLSNISK